MRTIILPGYSERNKEWGEELIKSLKLKVKSEISIHYWRHWGKSISSSLSLREELPKILEEIGTDGVNIIAKSVGTMVCMHVLQAIPGQIKKIILCGIPSTSDERLGLFKKSLADFPTKNIIVFQNEKDPLGSYKEVKKFMAKVSPKIKVVKTPRADHHYPYPSEFRSLLKR